jgi:hypothetical protein
MIQASNHPQRKAISPRELSTRERAWVQEILATDPQWSGTDIRRLKVVAECSCGECRSGYLEGPQNLNAKGTRGYIGRIEIRTNNEFGITVTLDQLDGKLSELYVNAVDLGDAGLRPFPDNWTELAHIVERM